MKILHMVVGPIATNCYIVVNEKNNEAVVVDPGDEGDRIAQEIKKAQLTVKAIFLTHGHSDHISGLEEVEEATGAKIYMSKEDAPRLGNRQSSFSYFNKKKDKTISAPNEFFTDGEELTVAGLNFKIFATPGHTPGGVCIKCEDTVFCGDTVFAESIGRTDLPGGSYETILKSIKDKILPLDDNTKLLPGHGPATTVGWERRRNPFLQ